MRLAPHMLILACLLAGCGSETPSPQNPAVPPTVPSTASAPPVVALPADMPPLICADLEPPPVPKPAGKLIGRRCANPDGTARWIASFYQCADGKIWPILTVEEPTGANRPPEPTGEGFNKCLGRG